MIMARCLSLLGAEPRQILRRTEIFVLTAERDEDYFRR